MRIRIQLIKICKKETHEEFCIVVKNIKDCSKVRNNGALCKFTKLNKLADISNFLAFFLFLFETFSLLDPDPDPGGEVNADPDPQP